jgi:hypothetical protein
MKFDGQLDFQDDLDRAGSHEDYLKKEKTDLIEGAKKEQNPEYYKNLAKNWGDKVINEKQERARLEIIEKAKRPRSISIFPTDEEIARYKEEEERNSKNKVLEVKTEEKVSEDDDVDDERDKPAYEYYGRFK